MIGGGGFGGGGGGGGGGGPMSALGTFHGATGKAYDPNVARRLFRYLGPHHRSLILALFYTAIASLAGLAGPFLIKLAIDGPIAVGDQTGLNQIALIAVLSYVIYWGATYLQNYTISWIGQRVLHRLRRDLFEHYQRLSLKFYSKQESGVLISRLTNDINVINEMLSAGIVNMLSDLLILVGIVAILLYMSVPLALLTFTVLPVMVIITLVFTSRAKIVYLATRETIGKVAADLQENISGVRVIQSFSREPTSQRRFDERNQANRVANIRAVALSSIFLPSVELISTVALAIVIWFGGQAVLADEVTLGVLVAFIAYVNRFFQPIRELSQVYNTLQATMAGSRRVFELIDTEPDIADRPGAIELPPIRGRVEFRDVYFRYLPDEPVLHDVSFVAEPGQTIALVGPTGAGKSSIINLITRFYDVDSGMVMIDGHDVRDVTLPSLRSKLGIVLQDPFLFVGTIAENIRYGRLDASDAEVEAAARLLDAHDFISELPQGYRTPVAERGVNLSIGQRQLISFARAVLANPRILILDEATSSVDTRTERQIQTALERLLKGRTSFVIAHRLSTIRNADLILVVANGGIVERGTHQELLRNEGLYYELNRMQFRVQEIDDRASAGLTRHPD
ncbi:MAG TPA: ABC transporter ATP-binding protein [Chloroflexota bacterium]|nr:ABC transporter ATP-binding protein [Chloroflexota bacterium]